MIGEIVGEYKIVGPLVQGAIGDVFIGQHREHGTRAAIEILHATVAANAGATQAYLDTVRTASNARHAAPIKVMDAGTDGNGRSYVIMELLEGDTLAKRLATSGRMSLTQIGDLARQLAHALAATHDDGVVHGDLRPDAIFVLPPEGTREGLKITEWGVAALKRSVGIEITPVYTAPEVLRGEPIDWRIDAYGLGCVAYEMATGEPPFSGATPDELRMKHLDQVPPSARSLMPDVAPVLDQLIGRLLSKRPEDRYGSMREIARAFEPFAGGNDRPLAPTAEIPAVEVPDDLAAQAGELSAKEPAKEPTMESMSSIQIEGPEASMVVVEEAPPRPVMATPAPIPGTLRGPPRGGSKTPLVLALVFLVLAGAAVVAFMLR